MDKTLKNRYIISSKISTNNSKSTYKSKFAISIESSKLYSSKIKGALLAFKRALVRPQKGVFCKSIRRLLEAKRACIGLMYLKLFTNVSGM